MSVIIAIFLLAAAFYLMTVVTEEFFVPAIDKLATKLNLSNDAAGATLLALGSSAPEFFTALIAILGISGSGHSDLGAGTIVGSAIFNVLVIIGASAMFKAVKLRWQPVIRDQVFYVITIILLLLAFRDGKIYLWESIVFVVTYVIYVITVVNWRKFFPYDEPEDIVTTTDKEKKGINKIAYQAFNIFLPNPDEKPKLIAVTFIASILVIAGLSWVLVSQVVVIAETLNINATFLALTVLAAGTSLPDLIGSIVVAKKGRGDMAVSNAIGSNIFDILFCLGFPWLLVLSSGKEYVEVGTDNLTASVILLFATVVSLTFMLIIRNWKIGHKSGLLLIGLYVCYVVYTIFTVVL